MSTIQPVTTFHELLHERDKGLYYKWLYHGKLTASEKDIIQCVAIQARAVTNFQGE